jgi:hypothetical protein
VLAKGLTERPRLFAPTLVHVALRRAVVDLETGRVAVARRRAAVADQRNVTAFDERGPGIALISHRQSRREDQRKGKRGEHQKDSGNAPEHESHHTNGADVLSVYFNSAAATLSKVTMKFGRPAPGTFSCARCIVGTSAHWGKLTVAQPRGVRQVLTLRRH